MKPAIKPAKDKISRKRPRKNPLRPKRTSTKMRIRSTPFTSRDHHGCAFRLFSESACVPRIKAPGKSLRLGHAPKNKQSPMDDLNNACLHGDSQPRCPTRNPRTLAAQKRFCQLVDSLTVASANHLRHDQLHDFTKVLNPLGTRLSNAGLNQTSNLIFGQWLR
jgi:hypothetical protein